jgi:hypothetical protein
VGALVLAFLIATVPYLDDGGWGYDREAWGTFLVAGWVILARWLWLTRRDMFVRGQLWRLCLCVAVVVYPSGMLAVTNWHSYGMSDVGLFIRATGVGAVVTVGVWIGTRGRAFWALVVFLGLAVLAPGAALTLRYAFSAAAGHEWSPFTDPRPGQIYDQYPLRWDEVGFVGPVIALIGGGLLAWGLVLRWRSDA